MAKEKGNRKRRQDGVGRWLYRIYIIFLLLTFAFVGRLIWIQVGYKPADKIVKALVPESKPREIAPQRGNILADDGSILAMSLPIYDISIDCTVCKEKYDSLRKKNPRRADSLEQDWRRKAELMCKGLCSTLSLGDPDKMYRKILSGRANGKQYMTLAKRVERKDYVKLKKLPLFDTNQFAGGIIVEPKSTRKYPYGSLALRTIGFARDEDSPAKNKYVGIEGAFNHRLHGEPGEEYMRIVDGKGRVRDSEKSYRAAVDGCDVYTTLNISFQDIADKALRERIIDEEDVEGACLAIMDVETGAIKAMVNLSRDNGSLYEMKQNLVIGRTYEPGSVFKTVTLTSTLSDGFVKSLDETMPTNHGKIPSARIDDHHIREYEDRNKSSRISVMDGFKISSNYVLSKMAIDSYGTDPQRFIDNIHLYNLGHVFKFDIEGLGQPYIPTLEGKKLPLTTLARMSYGYSVKETPLHLLTFYNAIAAKGKMMAPYLIEKVEKDGVTVEKHGPSILNGSICSKAVADSVGRALLAVTGDGGTAKAALKGAKCHVAGKTGTSFAVIGTPTKPYEDEKKRKAYQGTFVGYFPAENPRYSIICCIFTKPTDKSYQGGGIPAKTVREVVDKIYLIDPSIPYVADTTNIRTAAK